MADLYPIVIPPLEHTYKSIKYTCAGEGLLKDGYFYDPYAERFIPPKSKIGAAADIEKKPVAWWKAQCSFRGLNQSGSISDLQLRLREAKKKMMPELKSAETELNREFKKSNKVARGNSWTSYKSDEQKAKADPKRYLTEVFPENGTGRPINLDVVVLKLGLDDRLKISDAAEDIGLTSVSVAAPWTSSKKPSPDHWVVVGRASSAVLNQARELERETSRSKQTFENSASKSQPPKGSSSKPSVPRVSNPNVESPTPRMKPPVVSKFGPTPGIKQTARKHVGPDRDSGNEPSHSSAIPKPRSKPPVISKFGPTPKTKQTARKTAIPDEDSDDEMSYLSAAPKSKAKAPVVSPFSGFSRNPLSQMAKKPGPSSNFKTEESQEINNKPDNSWDVRGSWEIKCKEIEEQWGSEFDGPLTLDLYLQSTGGKQQLYGMFHFRVIEGIMRFEKPIRVSKSEKTTVDSKKRKREDMCDDEDVDMGLLPSFEGDKSTHNYSEKDFFLSAKDKPTARRPTWHYRWRGRETGEGEIQLGSDRPFRSITFSDRGNRLSGTFSCNYVPECHFTGVKVSSHPNDRGVDPEAQWTNHSEAAHEYARKSRWGSSRW